MPQARVDPFANYDFLVEIEGITTAGFSECYGLAAEVDVIEYREGGDIHTVRKIPGLARYSPIVLKRGISQDKSLWTWFQQVLNGQVQRLSGAIVLLDSGRREVVRWNFRAGWPSRWEGPWLRGKGNDIAIETLEIQHEGLELE